MTEVRRILTFRTNDLGMLSTFVLTFDDEKIPGIYKDVFPTAFKVTQFGASGPYTFSVVYVSKLGFTRAQLSGGVVIPASTYTPIGPGEETTLLKSGSVYSFTPPTDLTPPSSQMVARNGTPGREDIGVGFFERPDREPSQILVFEGVGAGSGVQSIFSPILRGYMTSGYQENAVLRGQIFSPVLFMEDLVQLPETTNWRITFNSGSGAYTVSRDNTI